MWANSCSWLGRYCRTSQWHTSCSSVLKKWLSHTHISICVFDKIFECRFFDTEWRICWDTEKIKLLKSSKFTTSCKSFYEGASIQMLPCCQKSISVIGNISSITYHSAEILDTVFHFPATCFHKIIWRNSFGKYEFRRFNYNFMFFTNNINNAVLYLITFG